MRLGIVGNRRYEGLTEVLSELLALAPLIGVELYFEPDLHDVAMRGQRLEKVEDIDALVTLGGDGTLLRGARLLENRVIPILGVNFGRLGFLTSCAADELGLAVRRLAAGDFEAEPRMILEARLLDAQNTPVEDMCWHALNDVVLHKGGFARVVRMQVAVDGEVVASYGADGIIVSTPTGSTAYSMSAGGPVVVPTLESILVTPICPHTLAVRPILVPPTAVVTLHPDDGPEEIMVTVDGQVGATLSVNQSLSVRRGDRPVHIVRFAEASFFVRLRRKLGWGGLSERDDTLTC